MARRTKKVDNSVDILSDATYQMVEGNVSGKAYADTVLSALDDSKRGTSPASYIRGLRRYRRVLLEDVVKTVDKTVRITRNIKMIQKLQQAKETAENEAESATKSKEVK